MMLCPYLPTCRFGEYAPETNVDGYDQSNVNNENIELIAAVPYDPSADTFIFITEEREIAVKYTEQHDLEVTYSDSLGESYMSGTYSYQPPVTNLFSTPEIIHDPKTPNGRMNAGMA